MDIPPTAASLPNKTFEGRGLIGSRLGGNPPLSLLRTCPCSLGCHNDADSSAGGGGGGESKQPPPASLYASLQTWDELTFTGCHGWWLASGRGHRRPRQRRTRATRRRRVPRDAALAKVAHRTNRRGQPASHGWGRPRTARAKDRSLGGWGSVGGAFTAGSVAGV